MGRIHIVVWVFNDIMKETFKRPQSWPTPLQSWGYSRFYAVAIFNTSECLECQIQFSLLKLGNCRQVRQLFMGYSPSLNMSKQVAALIVCMWQPLPRSNYVTTVECLHDGKHCSHGGLNKSSRRFSTWLKGNKTTSPKAFKCVGVVHATINLNLEPYWIGWRMVMDSTNIFKILLNLL